MNDYYALPDYVEDWIDETFRHLPRGWDIVAYPNRGCLQIVDKLKRVRNTYGYHAIHEGMAVPKEWTDE
jgi:hypothetical protein